MASSINYAFYFSLWVPDGFGTCDCLIIEGDTLTVSYSISVA